MAKKIDCGSSCFLRRKGCKDIKKCACDCGPLKAININLYDSCVTACNGTDRPSGPEDFKCNFLGGEVLYNQYAILDCGFNIEDGVQWQNANFLKEFNEEDADRRNQTINIVMYTFIGLLVLAIINFVTTK